MKRIAWISDHASPLALLGGADGGGQNVYVGQLAKHLVARGTSVDVFTRRDHPHLRESADWQGARVIHVPAGPPRPICKEDMLPYMADFTSFLLAFCRRERYAYDLLHANFFMSALVAMNVKRKLGIPFVVTFHALGRVRRIHQGDADVFPPERMEIEDRAVAEADCVIAECPQDRSDLIELYSAKPEKLRIVPCGFAPQEFGPSSKKEARKRLGLELDVPVVLQLGRLVPRKGIDNVIRAMGRLHRIHGMAARLLVVGGEAREPDPARTPEIGRLAAIARQEEVADRVTFVGSRERQELRNYYCAADVFVTTPWYEPFGITPVEAMACGTPVIGSAVGGIKSTVRHNETGFLVPPKDPDALAARLAELLSDPVRLANFGARSLEHARTHFTWRRVAGDLAKIYDEVSRSRQHRSTLRWSGQQPQPILSAEHSP
jgi:glycosyltransferase involved in cell wall biosynthesis